MMGKADKVATAILPEQEMDGAAPVLARLALPLLLCATISGWGCSGTSAVRAHDAAIEAGAFVEAQSVTPEAGDSGTSKSDLGDEVPSDEAETPPIDSSAEARVDSNQSSAEAMPPDTQDDLMVTCDLNPIMQLLAQKLGRSACYPTASSMPEGYIDFTGEGRVYLITIDIDVGTPETQTWVDSLANIRWPCMAGQELGYGCAP